MLDLCRFAAVQLACGLLVARHLVHGVVCSVLSHQQSFFTACISPSHHAHSHTLLKVLSTMADHAADQLQNVRIADGPTKEQMVDENGQPLSKRCDMKDFRLLWFLNTVPEVELNGHDDPDTVA